MNDMIQEIIFAERVFYLPFEVTIPAHGSTQVQISSLKEPSFDFACAGTANAGTDGYDMVT